MSKESTFEENLISAIILKKKTQKCMHSIYKYESPGHSRPKEGNEKEVKFAHHRSRLQRKIHFMEHVHLLAQACLLGQGCSKIHHSHHHKGS